jgi:NADP-dependent 3-hydroxy acid dehydrogenase YdfG
MANRPLEGTSQPVFVILGAAGGIGSCAARRLCASAAGLVLAGRDRAKLEPPAYCANLAGPLCS